MQIRRVTMLLFGVSFLVCGGLSAQNVTEFPLASDACCPRHITAGPDGNLWFSQSGVLGPYKIGRITTSGNIVDFPIEDGHVADANDIAPGPDGNLWFTQSDGIDGGHSAINRMTPAGVLTRFPTEPVWPGPFPSFTGPYGITAGPDGNLWVTLNEVNSIARITPAGEFRDFFSIPTPGSRPTGITAGPDGNLWFTEWSGNKIGRITPAGVITEFAIPTPTSRPVHITTGSDGNLWFTQPNANRIGRITPDGVVTEFPIPTAASLLSDIAAGPDGNLWFTEWSGNKIGRITPAGVITEFSSPTPGSDLAGITAGPDGNIWFTERAAARIGRLTLAPAIDSRILPVVGSTPGVGGSFFRTSVQLHNPTDAPMAGRIVFHPSGVLGGSSDAALSYSLSPGQTQSIDDLLPAMGRSGLGSADLEVTAGAVPAATVRVFNDAGAPGTTGFTEEPMRAEEALRPGRSGVLLIPSDLTNFRFNLGVRTLETRATATLSVRNASGAVVETLLLIYPASYHEQQDARAFLGISTLPAGGSIGISIGSGSAIFYGATVDNATGDPSLQIARAVP